MLIQHRGRLRRRPGIRPRQLLERGPLSRVTARASSLGGPTALRQDPQDPVARSVVRQLSPEKHTLDRPVAAQQGNQHRTGHHDSTRIIWPNPAPGLPAAALQAGRFRRPQAQQRGQELAVISSGSSSAPAKPMPCTSPNPNTIQKRHDVSTGRSPTLRRARPPLLRGSVMATVPAADCSRSDPASGCGRNHQRDASP